MFTNVQILVTVLGSHLARLDISGRNIKNLNCDSVKKNAGKFVFFGIIIYFCQQIANHGNECKTKQGKGETGKPDDIRFLMRGVGGTSAECIDHRDVPTDEASWLD